MTFTTSRRLATVMCPFFLFVDVWRRFGRWHEWPIILDDVLAGVLLLIALLKLRRGAPDGRLFLVAGWGYGTGMMYMSFVGQLMERSRPDVSGLPTTFVLGVKAAMLAICVLGLVGSLRGGTGSGGPAVAGAQKR
jgi:hypothetical protein